MLILDLVAQEANQAIIGVITVALPSLILNIVTIATGPLLRFLSTSAKLVRVRISRVVSYERMLQESFPTDVFKWLKQVIHDCFNTSEVGLQASESGD